MALATSSKKDIAVPFPRYNGSNETHNALADKSRHCERLAKAYLRKNEGISVGKGRKEIREAVLKEDLEAIDALLKPLLR